jgi:hypothetical protein
VSFGEYLAGAVELLVVLAAIGFAAVRLRGRMLPSWSGAPARLAEVVLGISLLVVILELVGVVGLYRPGWVLAASILAGLAIGVAAGRPDRPRLGLPAPPAAPVALALAVGAALLVAGHWTMPTQVGLDIGMYLPNTTWHNEPFAARFVQEAQVGALHFTEVLRLTVWFYPQNSELLHSAGLLFLGSDFLSPLLNLGWMSLSLLAAWSFGRPYAAGAAALLGVALVLDAEMLLLFQPGDAKNDTIGLFFLLASAAILVNAEAQRREAGAGPPAAGARVPVRGDKEGLPSGARLAPNGTRAPRSSSGERRAHVARQMTEASPPRNPFRNEADAFRVLLMISAGGAIVIALALLVEPLVGALAGLILLGVGAWRAWGLLQAWRAWGREKGASGP